jgi:hypothetical protein
MSRVGRVVVSGFPYHVTQQDNRGAAVFESDADRKAYLRLKRLSYYLSMVGVWACALAVGGCLLLGPDEHLPGNYADIGVSRFVPANPNSSPRGEPAVVELSREELKGATPGWDVSCEQGPHLRVAFFGIGWLKFTTYVNFEITNLSDKALTVDPRECTFTPLKLSRFQAEAESGRAARQMIAAYEFDGSPRTVFRLYPARESLAPEGSLKDEASRMVFTPQGPPRPAQYRHWGDFRPTGEVRFEEPHSIEVPAGSAVHVMFTYRCGYVRAGRLDLVVRPSAGGNPCHLRAELVGGETT